ncbi:hypothetical protein [Streptomyces collinus]|uniref:hypothetical protein n=1 Tax=Streptomyces collinus TaxID=42684 RepID=UPI0033D272C3
MRTPRHRARHTGRATDVGCFGPSPGPLDDQVTPVLRGPTDTPSYRAAIHRPAAARPRTATWDRPFGRELSSPIYADSTARRYIPYFYQLGTQLGYFDVPTANLADLLRHPDAMQPRTFVPRDIPMRFDPAPMPDIDHWASRNGHRLLFVNGTQDPAVAEFFHPRSRDSRVLWASGSNHHATISGLSSNDRAEALALLTRWTSTR